jgi:Kef-type K+ transport system membrane component KefB
VISVLAELGVIVLLFEIGLESNLKELLAVGYQGLSSSSGGRNCSLCGGNYWANDFVSCGSYSSDFCRSALTATSIGITSKVLLN